MIRPPEPRPWAHLLQKPKPNLVSKLSQLHAGANGSQIKNILAHYKALGKVLQRADVRPGPSAGVVRGAFPGSGPMETYPGPDMPMPDPGMQHGWRDRVIEGPMPIPGGYGNSGNPGGGIGGPFEGFPKVPQVNIGGSGPLRPIHGPAQPGQFGNVTPGNTQPIRATYNTPSWAAFLQRLLASQHPVKPAPVRQQGV